MNTKFKTSLVFALIASSALASGVAVADDEKPTSVSGCYRVSKGYMLESSITEKSVIGTYKFTLVSVTGKGAPITLKGPLSGGEGGGDGEAGEIHGSHSLGTDARIGTLSTEADSVEVTGASCPSAEGKPQLIKGLETLNFATGTGIFSKIKSGKVVFDLTFDGCSKPSNPIADLTVRHGEICFQ